MGKGYEVPLQQVYKWLHLPDCEMSIKFNEQLLDDSTENEIPKFLKEELRNVR